MSRTATLVFALVLSSALVSSSVVAETLLEHAGDRLELVEGRLRVSRGEVLAVAVVAIEFNFMVPESITVRSRSAREVRLEAVYPSDARHHERAGAERETAEITVSRVSGGFHVSAQPEWARNSSVRLEDHGEHFFGMLEPLYPNNRRSPDLRGNVVDIEIQGDAQQYYENYASAWSAFFMTSQGYASFFDTFARGRYSLGIAGQTQLYHRTGRLDWYVFLGADGDEILRAYYAVIGAPKRVPLWAMGPTGWRDQNNGGAAEILADVEHLSRLRIPFTSWWVDRPYSDGGHSWSKMNFGELFAKPEEWIETLRKQYGLELMTWIAPMTFGDHDFPALLAGTPDYFDLTAPEALAEFERRLSAQYRAGVRGHKMDRADEYFSAEQPWADETPVAERRNKYVFLYAKTTHDMLTRAWGGDHFNFARAAIHRAQPYLSAVWAGDTRSSWAGLGASVANAMRVSYMGFPVWGSDVGGYLGGRIDEELYARWLQFGALSGLFEIKLDNAGGQPEDRPPWVYGERLESAFREACELRMELLPYLYSLANTSADNGVLMKPLAYVWPKDEDAHGIWDEYLLGPALLVAPITEPGGKRRVYVPDGSWYALDDPAQLETGPGWVDVEVPFDRIPVYVRENSLYLTGSLPVGSGRAFDDDVSLSGAALALHAFPGPAGTQMSFDYVDTFDGHAPKTIRLSRTGDVVSITSDALGARGVIHVRADAPPVSATLSGTPIEVAYDPATRMAMLSYPAERDLALEMTLAAVQ
jgi:alpha-glucosidase (family GH31 glycosyl hydrolase)